MRSLENKEKFHHLQSVICSTYIQNLVMLGAPVILDVDSEAITLQEAREYIREEADRGDNTYIPDPGTTKAPSILNSRFIEDFKKRHPFLKEYSDEIIAHTPIETLMKLESTSIKLKNLEKAKGVEERLTTNRDNLATTSYQVKEEEDNRWSKISEARFLPGLVCSATKAWLRGRDVKGVEPDRAVTTYDMACMGLAGFVTPKGWTELHDPGSSKLTISLFSINNCGKRTYTKQDGEGDDDFNDIADFSELKRAIRALREAMAYVHPWNKSVSALEGFLLQTSYCKSDLEGVEKSASTLCQFVDYVLRENSNRWRGQEPFLTTSDLKGTWESFFSGRPINKTKKKPTQPPTQRRDGFKKIPAALFNDDICVMYNIGKCLKPPGHTLPSGKPLRHVCNHRADPAKPSVACGANHAAFLAH